MKKKILVLFISIIFTLTLCSGCTQNNDNNISNNNMQQSESRYSEDANITEHPTDLNEDKLKLVILKKRMLRRTIPCRGVKIGRHL